MSWPGWSAPIEPEMPHRIICWTGSRFVPLDWWDQRNKITFDHRKTEQAVTEIERPVFGRKGA